MRGLGEDMIGFTTFSFFLFSIISCLIRAVLTASFFAEEKADFWFRSAVSF